MSNSNETSLKNNAEYVLGVIVDEHRQQCQFDPEADPTAKLNFETTVIEWRVACDLVGWRKLGHAINQRWGLSHNDEEWFSVFEPEEERTLWDICKFIAKDVVPPQLSAVKILGRDCLEAGIFRQIQGLLKEAGANVSNLTPSTCLDEYARHYFDVFVGPISRLAPNAIPLVKVSRPWYKVFMWGLLLEPISKILF